MIVSSAEPHLDEVTGTTLPALTSDDAAHWYERRGHRVVERDGHYWRAVRRGFYQPVHLLDRLGVDEAARPAHDAWGYRCALRDEDASGANATIPVRLMQDVSAHDTAQLSSNRRNQLRRCAKRCHIGRLRDPEVLRRYGWGIVASSAERIGFTPPTPEEYVADFDAYADPACLLVLVGIVADGRPGGYLTGYAVDGTAYVDQVHVKTQDLRSYMGVGLLHEFVEICRRTPGTVRIVHGLDRRENPSLGKFKDGMGFPVVEVPARVALPPGAGAVLRRVRPLTYHRLTGRP